MPTMLTLRVCDRLSHLDPMNEEPCCAEEDAEDDSTNTFYEDVVTLESHYFGGWMTKYESTVKRKMCYLA